MGGEKRKVVKGADRAGYCSWRGERRGARGAAVAKLIGAGKMKRERKREMGEEMENGEGLQLLPRWGRRLQPL